MRGHLGRGDRSARGGRGRPSGDPDVERAQSSRGRSEAAGRV